LAPGSQKQRVPEPKARLGSRAEAEEREAKNSGAEPLPKLRFLTPPLIWQVLEPLPGSRLPKTKSGARAKEPDQGGELEPKSWKLKIGERSHSRSSQKLWFPTLACNSVCESFTFVNNSLQGICSTKKIMSTTLP